MAYSGKSAVSGLTRGEFGGIVYIVHKFTVQGKMSFMEKKRWIRRLLVWAAFALPAVVLTGCRSDQYYQDIAVQRARAYLLEQSPELTADQIYFVKFNNPFFLTADVLGEGGMPQKERMTSRQQQICVTWAIPGMDRYYMVFGVSSGRMNLWYPNRLIRRAFTPPCRQLESAIAAARAYAQNALYSQMNTNEFNSVRFTLPSLLHTDFELSVNPEMTLTPEECEKEERKMAASCQFTLAWKMDAASKESMVFCGTAAGNMSGWKINFAGRIADQELAEHTLKVLKTPKDSFTDFEPLEPPVPPEEETVPEPEEGKETPAAEEKEDKEKPAEEKSAENAAPAGEKPAAEKSVNSAPAGEKSAAVKEEKPAGTAPAKEEVR